MAALPPLPLPRLAVAVRGPGLLGAGGIERHVRMAASAGLPAIHLHLTGPAWLAAPEAIARRIDLAGGRLDAVWMPRPGNRPLAPDSKLLGLAVALAALGDARAIVLDRPTRPGAAPLLTALRAAVPPGCHIAFALRPEDLEGTRAHLAALSALRRTAEEWEYDLALDLDGPIDSRWEAEAAITRLAPRLAMIRFGPLASHPPGRGRARLSARVLACAADLGFAGTVALSPRGSAWQPGWTSVRSRSLAVAATHVRSRFAALAQTQPADDPGQPTSHPPRRPNSPYPRP